MEVTVTTPRLMTLLGKGPRMRTGFSMQGGGSGSRGIAKKCLNVRQKLATRNVLSLSLLSISHSPTFLEQHHHPPASHYVTVDRAGSQLKIKWGIQLYIVLNQSARLAIPHVHVTSYGAAAAILVMVRRTSLSTQYVVVR